MKRLILATILLLATGCSTAGPFVISISSDGNGNLIVEKGYVMFNGWTGTIHNIENTKVTKIKLFDVREGKVARR